MIENKVKYYNNINTNLYVFLSIVLFIAIIFTSCILDDDASKIDQNEFYIDQETAIIVAENILFPSSDMDSQRRELQVNDYTILKTVESVEPLSDDDGNNLMYIINYEGSGFVILSADRRMEPILAHSTENGFDTRQDLYNPGLVIWIDEFSTIINNLRRSGGNADRYLDGLWNSYIISQLDVMALGEEVLCNSSSYTRTIGPLLNTSWGQGCGYNEQVPHSGCTVRCDKAPTGCVATAMAQILKYHADRNWHGHYRDDNNAIVWPRDWSGMPYSAVHLNPGTDVPTLMFDIGKYLGMNYNCDGSSSNISSAHTVFIENFGFSTALRYDLKNKADYDKLIEEIDSGRPVYLRGNNPKDEDEFFSWFFPTYGAGHAWVADGYSHLVDCESGNTITDSYRIHMNWGWDGSSNGEFLKKSDDYPHHREMIYNLIPSTANR